MTIPASPANEPRVPVSAFGIQAPYAPGDPSPVLTGADNDAGGRDPVSGTVGGSQAAASARLAELQSDTFGQGSTIGDVMTMPPNGLDPAVGTLGETLPSGAFYDPPRNYGG